MEFVYTTTAVPIPKVYEVYELLDGAVNVIIEEVPDDNTDYTNTSPEYVKAFGDKLSGYLRQPRNLERVYRVGKSRTVIGLSARQGSLWPFL